MCGIVGFAGFRDDGLLRSMRNSIFHRGPDAHGEFITDDFSIGMQRLKIIDLEGGSQPMYSPDKKIVMVYNGEIYNYLELKKTLETKGHSFKTDSDTEVLLHSYMQWGIAMVEKLNGMFSFAICDLKEKKIYLARDRAGIKPLYYYYLESKLIFSSELKAILKYKKEKNFNLNNKAIDEYLKLRYVPGDGTLIKNINKLPAGNILEYKDNSIILNPYWKLDFSSKNENISFFDAVDKLDEKISKSINYRLIADVPVGAYLSGGVDSSIICSYAREKNSNLNTFSIGFNSNDDELSNAKITSKLLDTNHKEIICNDSDFENFEKICWHLDEPIGDAIVLPMYLLSKEASKDVKVVLSGEGGDEIFGGYLFHKTLLNINRYKKFIPLKIRKLLESIIHLVPHQLINKFFSYPANLGSDGKEKILNFLSDIERQNISNQYRSIISLFSENQLSQLYLKSFNSEVKSTEYIDNSISGKTTLDNILSIQYNDWLQDNILMKLDKMTMANSIEGRVPFLDHTLIEYAASLPTKMKVSNWNDKVILRMLSEKKLPNEISYRTKKPFYIPIDKYFKRPTFKKIFDQFKEENYLDEILKKILLKI